MKNKKILFLGRYKDEYSQQAYQILKKYFTNVNVVWSRFPKEKTKHKYFKQKYDYIFSFRSYFILKNKILSRTKKAAINFHPSIPKYRGFGCANYALDNGEKFFGCTAHIMNEKIDDGSIINVHKFRIFKKQTLDEVLKKTHKHQINQLKIISNIILNKEESLMEFIELSKEEKWGKKIKNKYQLNKFYEIKLNQSKKKILNHLRATILENGNFRPYIKLNGKKFFLIK